MSSSPRAFTDLVGCRVPLQLAPMGGGVGTPELAAAVCAAGGLGMLSSAHFMPLPDQIERLRTMTRAPFGVGFFAFDLPRRIADIELASEEATVVDLFWGPPDRAVLDRIHAATALGFWQVGSLEDALAAEDAGCDAVVVQGVEAGGHVRGTTSLLDLLCSVSSRVAVPLIAAGGIAKAGAIRDAFDAGASAVRIGTRLLATTDSAAHPDYLSALVSARATDTELTTAFEVGWPDAPHRVLRAALDAARSAEDTVATSAYAGQEWPVARWSAQPPSNFCSGNVSAMAMYAGTGVDDITEIVSVADVVNGLFGDGR